MGQTLGHYRILEKIGAGGMGEVNRAHDEQLDRDVALKVLPAGTLADGASRKLFRKEALALAKLNHPNIATVHEFGSQDGVDFLVMELIAGTSLRDKVKNGPLSEQEVTRLGMQLAEGLAAAHEQGVIHRDLKPANLMVTRDGRLKILDFGLAKFTKSTEIDVTQSVAEVTGAILGTLPYMPPEQLRGEPVDPRSDIYSAGASLYEAATGQRPFPELHGPALIGAILHQTAPPARSLNPRITPALEQILQKSINKEPAQRYQSARELLVALEGAGTSHVPALIHKPRVRVSVIAMGSVVLVAAIIGAMFLQRYLAGARARSALTINSRQSVAVVSIKNVSGRSDLEWVASALAEELTTELGAGEQLRTISGENISQMKIDLSLPDADSYAASTLKSMRRYLDVTSIVAGTLIPLGGGDFRLDLRLQDTVAGETLAVISKKGNQSNLDQLAAQAGAELRAKLGVAALTASESAEVKAAEPSNPEASKLYAEGLRSLRNFDNLKARDLLQKAVDAEPNFALAHSALASAWKNLGYDSKASEEAAEAFKLSTGLSRQDKLLVEGQFREISNDLDKAVSIYDSLVRFFPDDLEYGLLLAKAQSRAGKGNEAAVTCESLRRLPAPSGQDVRIDLTLAEAYRSLGNSKQVQFFAARAEKSARQEGAKLLLARALYLQGWAYEDLRDLPSATRTSDESQSIYKAAGELNGVAATFEVRANILADKGDLGGATASYEEEIKFAREVGNKKGEASALNNLGSVLAQQGDLAGAKPMYEAALAAFREIGDKSNMGMTLLDIGGVLKDQGDLAGAKRNYDDAMRASNEVNDKDGVALELTALGSVLDAQGEFASAKKNLDAAIATDHDNGRTTPRGDTLLNLGDVLFHQGNLTLSAKYYADAMQVSDQTGDKSAGASAHFGLGDLAFVAGDFDAANKQYHQALDLRKDLGEKETLSATRIAIANLEIAQGQTDQAVSALREVRDAVQKEKQIDDEIIATSLLARGLLAQAHVGEASRELDTIATRVQKSENLSVRLGFAIAKGRVLAASSNATQAISILTAVLASARNAGFIEYQTEAQLAIGEVTFKSTHSSAARTKLENLAAEADAKGFHRLALEARAAAKN